MSETQNCLSRLLPSDWSAITYFTHTVGVYYYELCVLFAGIDRLDRDLTIGQMQGELVCFRCSH